MFNNNPQFPTAAIRLVRANETVRNALGLNRPPSATPSCKYVIDRGGHSHDFRRMENTLDSIPNHFTDPASS